MFTNSRLSETPSKLREVQEVQTVQKLQEMRGTNNTRGAKHRWNLNY